MKHTNKFLLALLMAGAMLIGITACGGSDEGDTTDGTANATATAKADTTAAECIHDYQLGETVDATCTAKGSQTHTCSKCGYSYSEEIEMIAHNYTDATCTEPQTCSVCGATNGDANGHSYTDATCTEPQICSVCGATNGDANGHSYTDATCTEPATCTICQTTQGNALGHSYEITESIPATCIADGYETYTCQRCEDSFTAEQMWFGHSNGAYCEECKSIYYCLTEYNDPDSPSGAVATFHDNGAVDYGYIVNKSFILDEDSLQTYNGDLCYVMPEADMIAQIKSRFVFTDADIEALKAASPYTELIFYADGNFYQYYGGFGDIASYSHNLIGYTMQSDVLTLYFDYVRLEYDDSYTVIAEKHIYYYAIEYQYSGSFDLKFDGYDLELKTDSTDSSVRMAAVYQVDSVPSSVTKVTTQD